MEVCEIDMIHGHHHQLIHLFAFCHKNHCFDLVTITFSNHVYDLLHFQMYVQFSTAAIEWLCLPLLVCEILMGRC